MSENNINNKTFFTEVDQLKNTIIELEKNSSKVELIETIQQLKESNSQLETSLQELKKSNQQLLEQNRSLLASEEKYRLLAENLSDIIYTVDKYGIIEYISPQTEQYGIDSKSLISTSFFDFIHPDDRKKVVKKFKLIEKTSKGLPSIFRILDSNGNVCWLEDKGRIQRDADGDFIGHTGVIRDITKRKRAEDALLEKNIQIELLLNGANLGWWDWDISTGKEIYNDILVKNLGYSLNEVEPNIAWWENKIHRDDSEQVNSDLKKHFDGETEFYFNKHRLQTKTGEWKWFTDYGKIVERDKTGKPLRMTGILRDVNNEQIIQQKLKNSEEYYKSLIENSIDAISIIDEKGNNLFQSSSLEKVMGYSFDERKDKSSFEFIVPEDQEELMRRIENSKQKSGKVEDINFRVYHKDGSLRHLEGTAKNMLNSPIINGIIINFRDVTSRKLVEDAVLESENKFKGLFEGMFSGVAFCKAIFDENGNMVDSVFLEINPAYERFTNVKREDVIGHKISEILPNTEASWFSRLSEVFRTEESISFEMYHANSQKEYSAFAYKFQEDSYAIILDDITAEKRAKKEIVEKESNLRQIIDLAPILIFAKDEYGRYFIANKALAGFLGTTVENILGNTDLEIAINKNDAKKYMNDDKRVLLLGEKLFVEEESQTHISGKVSILQTSKIPFKTFLSSKPAVLGVSVDITELKRKEAELIATKEKAEESDRLKSAFLSNMSHEIRTPMNGILGFLSLLDDPDIDYSEKKEFTKIISRSGDRLLNTINNLIDISKIEAGQMNVSEKETCVNAIFDELHVFFSNEANSKDISLIKQPSLSNDLSTIITDDNKLQGILTNLIKNALKYTENGSVKFGYELKENFLEFFVKDTGIGVPKHRQKAIFNRFEQADIADSRAFEGSGLGLSIATAYVEMLGGEIQLISEESKGAKFVFTIPYVAKYSVKNDFAIEPVEENKNEKNVSDIIVLIAEDDVVSKIYLETILKKIVKELIFVKTGKEAVEMCLSNSNIDMIFMDIKMPIMNGIDATKAIREFNKDVVIIAQSAYALKEDCENALAIGCNDYISKPIIKDELLLKISDYVKNGV